MATVGRSLTSDVDAHQPTDRLAIIQHPRGGPKVIAEGDSFGECHGQIEYIDLDTLVGSSGAGVLNAHGFLYGVHNDGVDLKSWTQPDAPSHWPVQLTRSAKVALSRVQRSSLGR